MRQISNNKWPGIIQNEQNYEAQRKCENGECVAECPVCLTFCTLTYNRNNFPFSHKKRWSSKVQYYQFAAIRGFEYQKIDQFAAKQPTNAGHFHCECILNASHQSLIHRFSAMFEMSSITENKKQRQEQSYVGICYNKINLDWFHLATHPEGLSSGACTLASSASVSRTRNTIAMQFFDAEFFICSHCG